MPRFNLLTILRQATRNEEIVLLSLIAAVCLLNFPLQHYIILSRFQHYAAGICVVAVGFLIQLVWSWRQIGLWGRLTFLASGLYLAGFAGLFFINPWLDSSVSLQTESQMTEKDIYAAIFAVSGIPVGLIWIRWCSEEFQNKHGRKEQVTDD